METTANGNGNGNNNSNDKKAYQDIIGELQELMEVPEIRQVMLAKFEQVKLIFKEKIDGFYQEQWKASNVIAFPRIQRHHEADQRDDMPVGVRTGSEKEISGAIDRGTSSHTPNRLDWQYGHGYFDSAYYMNLPGEEQTRIFLNYFNNNKEFRREILSEFFLKKMPYAGNYQTKANSA